jgi:hypothetical protein
MDIPTNEEPEKDGIKCEVGTKRNENMNVIGMAF